MSRGIQFVPAKSNTPREPLRSFTEMAAEFGVSDAQLRGYFGSPRVTPPKPQFVSRNSAGRASWFKPSEMRAWWAADQEDRRRYG